MATSIWKVSSFRFKSLVYICLTVSIPTAVFHLCFVGYVFDAHSRDRCYSRDAQRQCSRGDKKKHVTLLDFKD